ncbi:MAG: tetratricopeptide repeat protein [Gammaproteobacteria bacterium]|nr:tetratricopeptide repeat protein [Gammaproteobacteria bacterium]
MPQTKSIDLSSPLRTAVVALALSATALFALSQTADAAGDDPSCPAGQTWSSSQGKCIKSSGFLDDEGLFDEGARLALKGQYVKAIEVLKTSSTQNDPRVLNYLGYSYRKLGQLDRGIRYYAKALAINPDYVRAREYLGEGYVSAGRIDKAREQLSEIEKRCGSNCEEYQQLALVITAAESKHRTH